MEDLDDLLFNAPMHSSVEFSVIGRHLGKIRKYQVRYYDKKINKTYSYTGDSATECFHKLLKKLANPDCHIHCCHLTCIEGIEE